MSKFGLVVKYITSEISQHSPAILTGLGVFGIFGTAVLAVKATPKAMKKIEEDKAETPVEKVKSAWTCYIPAAVAGTASAACVIGAQRINSRRIAALATAYTMSETAFKEYREKIVEKLGEKKEKEARDEINREKLEKELKENPDQLPIRKMTDGSMPCYDATLGIEFICSELKLRTIENDLNYELNYRDSVSVNEYLEKIGKQPTTLGDDLGWNRIDGLVDFDISYQTIDGLTWLVVTHRCNPKYEFDKFG